MICYNFKHQKSPDQRSFCNFNIELFFFFVLHRHFHKKCRSFALAFRFQPDPALQFFYHPSADVKTETRAAGAI